jgi:hypothetical protein
LRSRSSSVSIVSGYGRPGDRGSITGRGKDFSSNLCVQTGSEAHPASCTMGTGGPFPAGKARPGRDADHSAPSIMRSRMSSSYILSHQAPPWRVAGLLSCTYFIGIYWEDKMVGEIAFSCLIVVSLTVAEITKLGW